MGKMEDNCANVILCVKTKGRHKTSKEKEEQSKTWRIVFGMATDNTTNTRVGRGVSSLGAGGE